MSRLNKRRRLSADLESTEHESGTVSDGSAEASSQAPSYHRENGEPAKSESRIKAKRKVLSPTNAQVNDIEPSNSAILASTDEKSSTTFATLGVDSWLTTSLSNMAIRRPTRIQSACIPEIIAGSDCIGGSRTGSGKTVAFVVPILQRWAKDPSGIYALILTPTRELALQIYEQVVAIGVRQHVKAVLVTGGADMRKQAIQLGQRPHIVVATPGRLADHIANSGEETVRGLKRVKFVIFDEADRLLAAGKGSMLPDVEMCLGALPPPNERQTCLFTATVTPEVRALKEMPPSGKPPLFVCEVDIDALAIPPTLKQTYQLVNVVHKEKYLHVLLATPANENKSVIIFCNRTSTATLLEHVLRLLEHRVTSLHSGLHHEQRVSNLARFRAKAARILVATDVAARGLDVPEVGLVINYDLCRNPDDYIHRVGRTARAGRQGVSITLVGQRDVELVHAIEARVGREMEVYDEGEKVSIEGRVVRDALNIVGEKKREAVLAIEEGRDVTGKRMRKMKAAAKPGESSIHNVGSRGLVAADP